MIITISGRKGAGKTTVAKKLAQILDYEIISIGDLQGELAMKRGLNIREYMKLAEKDKSIHTEMDEFQRELGKNKDNIIVEGRIAFHFIPHSYKIFLSVDKDVGTKRIFKVERKDEPKEKTLEQTKEKMGKGFERVRKQFQTYYGIDFLDLSHYDLTIDTTKLTINQVINNILNHIKNEKNT